MTVKERRVLVGIRIDRHGSRQLLNWAIAKVAQPRDYVIAIHVVTTPGNQPTLIYYNTYIIISYFFPDFLKIFI